MKQSTSDDDEGVIMVFEEPVERALKELDELKERFNAHLNSVNNPHATTAEQTYAVDKNQMRVLLIALEDHQEESASFVMKVLLCLMVFFVCALIHFASAIQKDWVMIGLSFFAAVVPYGLLSSHVHKHRRLAAKLRTQCDNLLSNKNH